MKYHFNTIFRNRYNIDSWKGANVIALMDVVDWCSRRQKYEFDVASKVYFQRGLRGLTYQIS